MASLITPKGYRRQDLPSNNDNKGIDKVKGMQNGKIDHWLDYPLIAIPIKLDIFSTVQAHPPI